MSATIELIEGKLFKDGEEIGVYDAERNVLQMPSRPAPALYKSITAAIGQRPEYDFGTENPKVEIHKEKPSKKSTEPARTAQAGDKTPKYMQWFRDTYGEVEFLSKYGHRTCELDGERFGKPIPVRDDEEHFQP